MAPTFFGAGDPVETQTEGATLTPLLPTSTLLDDISFVLAHFNVQSTAPTAPTGFSEIHAFRDSTMAYYLWWKRLTGSDADPTVTDNGPGETALSGSNGFWARTYVWRGCTPSGTPFEDATVASGNSTTPQTAEITTTHADERAVCFLTVDQNTAWSSGHPPSGWADEVTDDTSGGASNHRFCVTAKDVAAAGTVAAATVGTLASGQRWLSVTLGLIEANPDILEPATRATLTLSAASEGSLSLTSVSASSLTTTPI